MAVKTHCRHGHAYCGDNLYLHQGARRCRVCRVIGNARRYREQVAGTRTRARPITHCVYGHAYDAANTYRHNGQRKCRACGRERAKAARAAMKREIEESKRELWNVTK